MLINRILKKVSVSYSTSCQVSAQHHKLITTPSFFLISKMASDSAKKRKADWKYLKARYASLQYLTIKPVRRVGCAMRTSDHDNADKGAHSAFYGEENLTIELDNYILLSPEAINLDETNRIKLHRVMNVEPLALIEYWAVDPTPIMTAACSALAGLRQHRRPPRMVEVRWRVGNPRRQRRRTVARHHQSHAHRSG